MRRLALSVVVVVTLGSAAANADTITHGSTTINMDFVTVGNPGNANDTYGYGAVDYSYNIGKYEVTENQWDAVSGIAGDLLDDPGFFGSGQPGNWSADQPVADISWYEAAMFCNWLTSGDVSQGAYAINGSGVVTGIDRESAVSTYGTTYVLPTENEWYKAAYYDGVASTYYGYPTGSNTVPDGIDFDGDTEFDAVFDDGYAQVYPNDVDNAGVLSPYCTMGQGGNVWEHNETLVGPDSSRGFRGGFWTYSPNALHASSRGYIQPSRENYDIGFRVARVPAPGGTPEFGSIGPGAFTGFEEAEDGATSFVRTAESTELAWTMIGGGTIASVVADLNDPDAPVNLHQFHLNNGWGNVTITTELIDLREFADVQVSLDLRTWDTSSGFESENGINVNILTSTDGLTFESIPWLSLMGADAAVTNQGAQHGSFTNYVTEPGLIPDDAATMKVRVTLNNDSGSEHIMLDNLWVTTVGSGPISLFWDGQGDGDWRDRDPVTELSRWTDRRGHPSGGQPRMGFHAVVRTDTVTVTGDREASSLSVESGAVVVAQDASLTLAEALTVQPAASIGLDHNASLAVGESLVLEGEMALTPATPTEPGEQAVAVAGEFTLGQDSTLTFNVDGADPFVAGSYTLISAEWLTGTVASSSGLGHYVSIGPNLDGLTYTATTLTVTIDKDLNPGDANLSGTTDVTDFNIWNAYKFTSGTDWGTGDFNGDGITDVRDFNLWNGAKFTRAGWGKSPEGQVPEPSAIILLLTGIVALAAYTWQQQERRPFCRY